MDRWNSLSFSFLLTRNSSVAAFFSPSEMMANNNKRIGYRISIDGQTFDTLNNICMNATDRNSTSIIMILIKIIT